MHIPNEGINSTKTIKRVCLANNQFENIPFETCERGQEINDKKPAPILEDIERAS